MLTYGWPPFIPTKQAWPYYCTGSLHGDEYILFLWFYSPCQDKLKFKSFQQIKAKRITSMRSPCRPHKTSKSDKNSCTLLDSYRPQHISCWKWLPRSLFRTKLCHTIYWEIPCGGLFRYYLPGGYKFNSTIAITETGCDRGYFRKCRVATGFGITCQAIIYSTVSELLPREGILGNPVWRPVSVLPARRL